MIALLLAGGVKGMIGLGLPLTAVSIITNVVDLRTAIAFIAVPVVATNVLQAFQGGRALEMLRRYWVINLFSVSSTWLGAEILFLVDADILTTFLGVVVVVYVAIIPIAMYLQARDVDKETFVRALAITFLISSSMLVIVLVSKGAIGREEGVISIFSLIPAFIGMAIGARLRGLLSETVFRNFVYVFLLITALSLIRKGLF